VLRDGIAICAGLICLEFDEQMIHGGRLALPTGVRR
jgi:hypothetical protein